MELPCEKFTVLDTEYVTENPRARSPYMLPSPRPETSAETSSREATPAGQAAPATRLLDRDDLLALVLHHDVVVLVQRVVVRARERPGVLLDESAVRPEVLERLPDLVAVGAAGLLDAEGQDHHRVIRVGHPDGRDDVARPLDVGILGLERG